MLDQIYHFAIDHETQFGRRHECFSENILNLELFIMRFKSKSPQTLQTETRRTLQSQTEQELRIIMIEI